MKDLSYMQNAVRTIVSHSSHVLTKWPVFRGWKEPLKTEVRECSMPVSFQSWSIHLFHSWPHGRLHVKSERRPYSRSMWQWRIWFTGMLSPFPRQVLWTDIDKGLSKIVSVKDGSHEQKKMSFLVMCLYQQTPSTLQRDFMQQASIDFSFDAVQINVSAS